MVGSKNVFIFCIFFAVLPDTALAKFFIFPTSGSSSHHYSSSYSGTFRSIDGRIFDVRRFYESRKLELNVKGVAFWQVAKFTTLKIPWSFDNGYKSDLFNTNPVLQLGAFLVVKRSNLLIEFGANNLLQIGGRVSERACVDSLSREFHCGTGLPWVDRPPANIDNQKKFLVRVTYSF